MKIFCVPLKVPMKEIESVTMIERPETVAELAPNAHWLFCRTAEEVIGFEDDPVMLSYSSWTVARTAS